MSFIVQPAPLIMTAPAPKSANVVRSGRHPGDALKAIDHPQGQNKSHEPVGDKSFQLMFLVVMQKLPIGLSSLMSLTYGFPLKAPIALLITLFFW